MRHRQNNAPAEPASFEDLYAAHAPLVLRLVGVFGVPRPDRDDVAQEVWIDVHRSLPLYDETKGTERAWIGGITRNAARDWRRLRRRRPELSTLTDLDPPDPRAAEAEAETVQARLREELRLLVERAIPNEDQRVALLLHQIEGMTIEEVAKVTEVKAGTAKWRVEMARIRLKKAAASLSNEERERLRAVVLPLGGVDGILRALRETSAVSDEEVARVWDRVVERIEREGGSIHDRLGTQAPAPADASPKGHTLTTQKLAGALGAVFLLGALVGAGAHELLSRDKASLTTIETEIRPSPGPTAEQPLQPAPTASAAPSMSSSTNAAPWESEAWILDRAQKAEPLEALRLADRHALRFPRSVYAGEREEIAIRALLELHQRAEAEERAAKLLRWAPQKRPAIEALLGRSFL